MVGTKTKAKVGAKGTKLGAKTAKGIIQEPILRSAVSDIAPPVAKLGMTVGKKRVNRKTRKQLEHLSETVGSVASQATDLAQQLGLVEPPKQKSTTPRVLAGAVIGAALMYLLEPSAGGQHRKQLAKLVGKAQSAAA